MLNLFGMVVYGNDIEAHLQFISCLLDEFVRCPDDILLFFSRYKGLRLTKIRVFTRFYLNYRQKPVFLGNYVDLQFFVTPIYVKHLVSFIP